MMRFRSTIETYVRFFERGTFHALIHVERRRKKIIK